MIEIMIVIGILGVSLALGIPAFARVLHREGMGKAVTSVMDAARQARANAILSGQPAEMVIHPKTKSIDVTGPTPFSATLPSNVWIELMGVNFVELQDAEEARVKFQPNATCDEFTLVLNSDDHKGKKLTLEVVTGILDIEDLK